MFRIFSTEQIQNITTFSRTLYLRLPAKYLMKKSFIYKTADDLIKYMTIDNN